MRELINKKFKKFCVIGSLGLMALGFASCGKSNTETSETTSQVTEVSSTKESTTEKVTETEATTEVTTEAPSYIDELNINDPVSIENAVDKSYSTYTAFYNELGISKDQIRDMIFVANDLYTDADGKLVIDEERALDAYMNIKKVLYSPKFNMDIYNTLNGPEYTYQLNAAPSLVDFIDQDLAGGTIVADEIKEYEALRDSQMKSINEKGQVDYDQIEKYIIKNEYDDKRNYSNSVDSVSKNGQKFILTAIHYSGLNMAAAVCKDEYIVTDKTVIKVNPTDDEVILQSRVIELDEKGLLQGQSLDNLVKYVRVELDENEEATDEELAKKINKEFKIEIDHSNLIVAYARFWSSMDIFMYIDDMCDEQNETVKDIQVKRQNTQSNSNVKEYTLS